jgi:Na+-transporting methylmalonyl-CoA/oxaloacetate decarboxylase gamma subunit
MPTHNHPDPGHEPEKHEVDASAGFERSDASVTGIAVFLVSLLIFVAVVGMLCYGIGKVINAHMNKEDGPNSKWTKTVDVRQLGNMPSSPELQNKMAEITQTFPTPRLLTDDGDQDVADLHAREDLLLNNYSWVDQSKGTVRIPIEQAIQLIAQRGLPVAPAVQTQQPMTGESTPTITVPLTNGFARTSYEQEEAEQEAVRQQQGEQK